VFHRLSACFGATLIAGTDAMTVVPVTDDEGTLLALLPIEMLDEAAPAVVG
jgi:hypothetical protein